MTQNQKTKQKEQEIIILVTELCKKKINEEYARLSEKLIKKLGRKREIPFVRGKSEIWATAVVHTIGTLNFLYDKSFLPYLSFDEVCRFYDTNKNTVENKSSDIRKLLNLDLFDEEFSTEYIQDRNSLNHLSMTEEGFLFYDDKEEDDDDEFDDMEDFEDVFKEIMDRMAITVKPKQPLLDWINNLDPEYPMSLDDFFDCNTYLFSDEEFEIINKEDAEMFVELNFIEIFEEELMALWTDPNVWPESMNFETFKEWFEYHVSTLVYDLGY